jgi:hypothetical protein
VQRAALEVYLHRENQTRSLSSKGMRGAYVGPRAMCSISSGFCVGAPQSGREAAAHARSSRTLRRRGVQGLARRAVNGLDEDSIGDLLNLPGQTNADRQGAQAQ